MSDITRGTADTVGSAMEAAGWSQVAISTTTGIPRTTLLHRLSGFSPFTVDELQRIGDVLDVEVHTLIGGVSVEGARIRRRAADYRQYLRERPHLIAAGPLVVTSQRRVAAGQWRAFTLGTDYGSAAGPVPREPAPRHLRAV